MATVVGPEGAPTTERRTATDCRGAYEAFDDTRAWVRSVDGVTAGPELTEAWNVPTTAGDATCAVVFGIARARATGHAEGEGADDVSDLAKQDACRQLGLTGADCDARARVHQTSKKMLFVNGQTSSEATVEVVVYERAEGEGRGATKLDACRAAIASACEAERCDGDTLVVEHIDDVPLRRHAVLPTRGLFDRPETAR